MYIFNIFYYLYFFNIYIRVKLLLNVKGYQKLWSILKMAQFVSEISGNILVELYYY